MSSKRGYELPKKIENVLGIFALDSKRSGNAELAALLSLASVSVTEGITTDSWNGGTYGHAVRLKLPLDDYLSIASRQSDLTKEIRDGLNKHSGTPNEHIEEVLLEAQPSPDLENWRQLVAAPQKAPEQPVEAINRIWSPGHFRLFISHKDSHKQQAATLKARLGRLGVSCFVAHEDIEPTQLWLEEIKRALSTMHAMACLISQDFHSSYWTDQEIGFALGRRVQIFPIRFGVDPYGFIGGIQGIPERDPTNRDLSDRLLDLMWGIPSLRDALVEGTVTALENSGSFSQTDALIARLVTLSTTSSDQLQRIKRAFQLNSQVSGSFRAEAALPPFFKRLE